MDAGTTPVGTLGQGSSEGRGRGSVDVASIITPYLDGDIEGTTGYVRALFLLFLPLPKIFEDASTYPRYLTYLCPCAHAVDNPRALHPARPSSPFILSI